MEARHLCTPSQMTRRATFGAGGYIRINIGLTPTLVDIRLGNVRDSHSWAERSTEAKI
jgi:hypothetical protein